MFSGYFSYWERHLSFSPCVDDEHLFRGIGPLEVLVSGRTIVLVPNDRGGHPLEMNRVRNGGLGMYYRWDVGEDAHRCRARFIRHEVELVLDDGDTFTWEMPSDHILPWPQLALWPNTYVDVYAVAQREMLLRGRSAYEEDGTPGLERMLRGIPGQVRRFIPTPTWRSTIETIQKE